MPGRVVYPLVHAAVFLLAVVAWFVVLGVGMAIVLLVTHTEIDLLTADPAGAVYRMLGAGGAGLLTTIQTVGLGVIAAVLCLVLPAPSEIPPRLVPSGLAGLAERLRSGLALRGAHPAWIAGAAIGGLTVWTFPTWLADRMLAWFPGHNSAVEIVGKLLSESHGLGRISIVFAVAIIAPVFEELVFRGYLWAVVRTIAPTWVAIVVTSLLFAAFHMDLVQSTALLPTAFFLGWLRGRSGSILPSMTAHFVNNAIGVVLAIASPADSEATVPLAGALAGATFTIAVALAAAELVRRSRPVVPAF